MACVQREERDRVLQFAFRRDAVLALVMQCRGLDNNNLNVQWAVLPTSFWKNPELYSKKLLYDAEKPSEKSEYA